MRTKLIAAVVALASLASGPLTDRAVAHTADFDGPDPLAGWTLVGDVSVDSAYDHTGSGGMSMRVAPGATATWLLRDTDDSGTVELWAYEDGTQRSSPDVRGAGPHLGVITTSGRVLTVGPIYAPYLSGNTTYAAPEYYPATESPWFKVTYLGIQRSVGWHRWTFDFHPTQGFKLYHNGSLNTRINWTTSDVRGFAGVVIIGDIDGDDNPQNGWIDDVSVTLGPPMEVEPGGVDLLEGIVPETDPNVPGPAPEIVPELAGQHPRLLFDAADIADLDAFRATPDGQRLWNLVVSYKDAALQVGNTSFQTNATEAQRKGFWRLPTVAFYYVMTGDTAYLDKAVDYMEFLLGLQHWETSSEIDCGMGAANMMIGAALAYDWLYHDLDPTFREEFRQKLWLHARRMYYAGHLAYLPGTHYWQNDPQNNHRWHRNAGFALCALAAWTGDDDQKWLMQQLDNELAFMAQWLPDDGTSHEGPGYEVFGGSHLTLALDAADRCLGTSHLLEPFFANCARYQIQTHTPGYTHAFNYGDTGGVGTNKWGYDVYLLKAAGVNSQSDIVSGLDALMDQLGVDVIAAWTGFIWYPRDVPKGTPGGLPMTSFFSDLGLLYLRTGWDAGGQGAMFKCGPFGGYKLNRYRVQNGMSYINVAHDDPDALTFILYDGSSFLAETDRYSYHKKTAALNGVLVNNIGQVSHGRSEGGKWSQPATGGRDMTEMGVVTAFAENDQAVAVEGEAAGAYISHSQNGYSRPDMDRVRRVFVWIPDRYILVLDDIRGPQPVDVTWLMQGHELTAVDAPAGKYRLADGDGECPFQVVSTQAGSAVIGTSPAENKGSVLGWQQLQLSMDDIADVRVASVYDLWELGNLTVAITPDGPDAATITVIGPGIDDTWQWESGQGRYGPSKLVGRADDGTDIIVMTEPEAETRQIVDDITGSQQPIIGAWHALTDHGPAGEFTTALTDGYIEPRQNGLRKLTIEATAPLDPATVAPGAVSIVGQGSGDQTALIHSVDLADDTQIVVTLASDLPDADWYTIALSPSIRGTDGSTLVGDLDVTVGRLVGDVNRSGTVSAIDMLAVRGLVGPVSAATAAADVDGSGAISGADLLQSRGNQGVSLP